MQVVNFMDPHILSLLERLQTLYQNCTTSLNNNGLVIVLSRQLIKFSYGR